MVKAMAVLRPASRLIVPLDAAAQGTAGRADEAATELQRAIAANPRETRAYYALALVDEQRGDTLASRAALARFVALAPSRYADLIADARRRLGSK